MAELTQDQLVEALSSMTVLQISELTKTLEDKLVLGQFRHFSHLLLSPELRLEPDVPLYRRRTCLGSRRFSLVGITV